MRILLQNLFANMQGGTEIVSSAVYDLLTKHGHEVFYFSTNREPIEDKFRKFESSFVEDIYTAKGFIKNPLKYFWNDEIIRNFDRVITDFKPDVIHLNYFISPEILFVCKKHKIPTVITFHMMPQCCPAMDFLCKSKSYCKDFKCKNGNYFHCIINKCRKNSLEGSIRKALMSYLYQITDAYANVNKFLCPSDALGNYIKRSNIIKNKEKIVTINNFLTDEELNTTPNYSNKGYFLYIGRLSKEKGVNYLLEAIKDLPRDIELHIVGKGDEGENLKQYAKENNLDNVKFLGFKNRDEIKEEYQNCISTILPCNWFEIFGMTNIESFINGKPVIASDIAGIPEIVEHNKTGLLFEPANVEQLKDCIIKYWNNSDLVIEHGKNAYQKALTKYSEQKYYEELMKIYKEVLNK